MRFPFFVAIFLASFSALGQESPGFRTWTDAQQRKIEAVLEKVDDTSAVLKTRDGRELTVPLDALSSSDQNWVKVNTSFPVTNASGDNPKAEADWPRSVGLKSTPTVQTIREDPDKKEFIYQSDHYEFLCDSMLGANLVREFSRIFEATWLVNGLLPLDFKPSPEDGRKKFQARIFTHDLDYHATGGPQGSAGVYIPRAQALMLPLSSLGVKMFGSKVTIDYKAQDYATLIHEITHQMMNHWLDRLPVWYIEGSAVYIQLAKYENGHFSFLQQDKRLRDYLLQGAGGSGRFQMLPIKHLMTMSSREWHAALVAEDATTNYASAAALTYYFYHLDDDGTGSHIKDYIRAIETSESNEYDESLVKKYLLRDRNYDTLQKDVQKSFRRIGIAIDFPNS